MVAESRQVEHGDLTLQGGSPVSLLGLLESLPVGVLMMDPAWQITYVNVEAERVLGPRSALVGQVIWERFPGTVGTEFEAGYRAAAAGDAVTFEAYYPAPLDAWYEVRAIPNDGGVALHFTDITARRMAQADADRTSGEQLHQAVNRAEQVLDNIGDGIFGLDSDGRAEFVNPATVALTGYSREELLGADMHALLHHSRPDGSPYPRTDCPTYATLHSGVPSRPQDEMFWRKDGTALPVNVTAVPVRSGDGALTGVIVSFRDLRERVAAEAQAVELAEVRVQEAEQRLLADRLQQALLTPPPEQEHLRIAVRYRPAAHGAQVGGDWYDAFVQPDGATMLVIGDVVGHDGTAAAVMGQMRGVLRTIAYRDDQESPSQVLSRVEAIARGLDVSSLATVILARVQREPNDPTERGLTLQWSNAGHPPPVLLHADGTVDILDTDPDLLFGLDPTTVRADHSVELPTGSTLLMFTDGLIERRGATLDLGYEHLVEALRDLSEADIEDVCDTLLTRMAPEAGDDDIALIAVRARTEDPIHNNC